MIGSWPFGLRDVIHDQPNNFTLSDKIKSIKYNAVLALTGTITGTSKIKDVSETRFRIFKRQKMAEMTATFIKSYQKKKILIFMI